MVRRTISLVIGIQNNSKATGANFYMLIGSVKISAKYIIYNRQGIPLKGSSYLKNRSSYFHKLHVIGKTKISRIC